MKKKLCLIMAVMLLGLVSCGREDTEFDGSKVANDDHFSMDFQVLDTSYTSDIDLEKGDTLDVILVKTSGRLNVEIRKDGEKAIYKGDDVESGSFSVGVPETGTYTVKVAGEKAAGSVAVKKHLEEENSQTEGEAAEDMSAVTESGEAEGTVDTDEGTLQDRQETENAAGEEPEAAEESDKQSASDRSDMWNAYAEVAQKYLDAFNEVKNNTENWYDNIDETTVNFEYCSGAGYGDTTPVWLVLDLNGDGTEEFFTGLKFSYENYDDFYTIYDVYTYQQDQLIQLMTDIGYRAGTCILCENGYIKDNWSGSAWDWGCNILTLPAGAIKLETVESLTSVGQEAADGSGEFTATIYRGELKDDNIISEEEYNALCDVYREITPEYTDNSIETIEALRNRK